MNHMSVDLETLDTRPSSIVLSVGAVVFTDDPKETLFEVGRYYASLHLQDQITAGRTMSEKTLRWWLDQSVEARQSLKGERAYMRHALIILADLYQNFKCERVWANGLAFDVAILEHAYHQHGLKTPWEYNAAREMRNFRDLCPNLAMNNWGVKHDALADALAQADYVRNAWRMLAGRSVAQAVAESELNRAYAPSGPGYGKDRVGAGNTDQQSYQKG